MATKVIYVGNGKWCYTQNCARHAREISLANQYKTTTDDATKASIANQLKETPTGQHALNALKVAELEKAFGRKLTIGTDLDNTVGDFNEGLRAFTAKRYNVPKEQWSSRFPELGSYNYYGTKNAWFKNSEEFTEVFHAAEKDGLYTKMPSFENAPETLQELKNLGFHVKGVTARLEVWSQESRDWLATRDILVDEVYHTGHEKEKVPGIDVYLEDSPEVIDRLLDHDKSVAIRSMMYNEGKGNGNPHAARFKDWKNENVTDIILGLLEEAKKTQKKNV